MKNVHKRILEKKTGVNWLILDSQTILYIFLHTNSFIYKSYLCTKLPFFSCAPLYKNFCYIWKDAQNKRKKSTKWFDIYYIYLMKEENENEGIKVQLHYIGDRSIYKRDRKTKKRKIQKSVGLDFRFFPYLFLLKVNIFQNFLLKKGFKQ